MGTFYPKKSLISGKLIVKQAIAFENNRLDIAKAIVSIINKRVKRPPDNPMNALISFGNTLLYTKTISQIYNTHLEQSISFLHEPSEGRFSLCLDLSEVFKPAIVFKTIFDLVNNRKINIEKHFEEKLNYSLLNENGKKIFIEAFEDRLNQTFEHPKLNRKITYKQAIN